MINLTWVTAPLVLVGSYAISDLAARLSAAIALRRLRKSHGASWMERARLAYPARLVAAKHLTLAPFAIGAIVGSQVAPWLSLPVIPLTILGGLAALAAVMGVTSRLERRFCSEFGGDQARRWGVPAAFILILPGLVTFGLMVAAMPIRWDWTASLITVAGLAAMTVQIFAGWLIPLRWLGLVRPASTRLVNLVDQTASRMGVRYRGVYELESPNANAIAWPVPKLIVFTGPIAEILDDDELTTIAAHELGHLDESWAVYLLRLVAPLFLLACATTMPLITSFGPLAGLAPFLGLLVLILLGKKVGRRMEERSDQLGREHEGEIAGTYAKALAKIHEANLMPVVMKPKRHVHPDLYDRLLASGVTPDYPRPDPPPGVGLAQLPLLLLFATAGLAIVTHVSSDQRRTVPTQIEEEASRSRGFRSIALASRFDCSEPLIMDQNVPQPAEPAQFPRNDP